MKNIMNKKNNKKQCNENAVDYLNKFLLTDSTVVVTGGLGLLGKEIVTALAQAGAFVIIADVLEKEGRHFSSELSRLGYKNKFIVFDISDIENLEKKIVGIFRSNKNVTGWVNSAFPRTEDWGCELGEFNPVSWQKNVDMHMNSYCLASWNVATLMSEQKGGSIVNMGSIYGIVGNDFSIYEGTGKTPPPSYSAIKAGINNFDKYLASYFGSKNVRINTVCPGGIFNNQKNKKFLLNYEKKVPMKRMGKADEISPAVLFLISNAASYVTGSTVIIDGGWTAI